MEAAHAENVVEEVLGLSEGVPGQDFRVARPPVVAGEEPFVVEVAEGHGWVEWIRVDNFAHSTPYDRHITLDPNSGQVDFGPAVREPDGTLRLFGAVPPKGSPVRVRAYRTGAGTGAMWRAVRCGCCAAHCRMWHGWRTGARRWAGWTARRWRTRGCGAR